MAANLVNKPRMMRPPQTISNTPTKGAVIYGAGIPILTKRPMPRSVGKRNF